MARFEIADPDADRPRRRWPRKGTIALAVVLLLIGWQAWQYFTAGITVSPQTTVITAPLAADGYPDFERYLVQLQSQGVTTQNNAAVLLWKALGPGQLDPGEQRLLKAALGIDEKPVATSVLQPLDDRAVRAKLRTWLGGKQTAERAAFAGSYGDSSDRTSLSTGHAIDEIVRLATARPWRAEQIPPLAAWVTANDAAIDLIAAASERPRYWSPSPQLLDGRFDDLSSLHLPLTGRLRDAAAALAARAMHRAGSGSLREAWRDVLAQFRLSRLAAQKTFQVEQFIALSLQERATEQTLAILSQADLPADLAAEILADLQSLPPLPRLADVIDQRTRLQVIASATGAVVGRYPLSWWGGQYAPASLQAVATLASQTDGNAILRDLNQVLDQAVAIGRIADRAQRDLAIDVWREDIDRRAARIGGWGRTLGSVLSKRMRTDAVADILLVSRMPDLRAAYRTEDRGQVERDLLLVAAALAVYRTEQGEYPQALDALAPGILAAVPVDRYTDEPLRYGRRSAGYMLYSVSENGVDDGGTDRDGRIVRGEWNDDPDSAPEDCDEDFDEVIRVPVPPLRVPGRPADGAAEQVDPTL